jgi:hypothetical protein
MMKLGIVVFCYQKHTVYSRRNKEQEYASIMKMRIRLASEISDMVGSSTKRHTEVAIVSLPLFLTLACLHPAT